MSRRVNTLVATAFLLCLTPGILAGEQQSENYVIEGASIQNGVGSAAIQLDSGAYGITLSAVGDPLMSDGPLARPGLEAQSGFVSTFSPATEVSDLAFSGSGTLVWSPARSAVSYNVYRGALEGLSTSYGSCLSTGIPATTADDPSSPALGSGYFYLVTATNSLDEEGASGFDSGSTPRTPTACPGRNGS